MTIVYVHQTATWEPLDDMMMLTIPSGGDKVTRT
jgi:hypothetical protein